MRRAFFDRFDSSLPRIIPINKAKGALMNTALIRAISMMVLTGLIIFPYFNCGAPSDRSGMFGSDDSECSSSPKALQECMMKVRFGIVPSVISLPGGSGTAVANGQCVTGGFPKVLIAAQLRFVANEALISQSPDYARCDGGVFSARVDMPNGITWTDLSVKMVLTMMVFEQEESTVNTPLNPPVVTAIPLKK